MKALICAGILALGCLAGSLAAAGLPVAEQNSLVQSRCAVCHADAHPNGGLSLEHFDAAHVAPSLAAMMLSKLRTGALGASGAKLPPKETEQAFTEAFIAQAKGAETWFAEQGPVTTASIVRELPAARGEKNEHAALYRLIFTCDSRNRKGTVQLAWSPVPRNGELVLSVDGKPAISVPVQGKEKMGNGSSVESGPASVYLPISTLPANALRVADLFPNESVEFPFATLQPVARQALGACFNGR